MEPLMCPKKYTRYKNIINLYATQTPSSHCQFRIQKKNSGRGGVIYFADVYSY